MPRDSRGMYVLPPGNPVVSGALIESTWANPTLEDIAAALTDSLDRHSRGAMLAEFLVVDGNAASPGLAFVAQTDLGLYRDSNDVLGISCGSVPVAKFSNNAIEFLMPITAGNIVFDNVTADSLTVDALNAQTVTAAVSMTAPTLNGNATSASRATEADHATAADSATTATNATNATITNDTATNATMYPTWVTATSSNRPLKVSSTKLTFNPSTGLLMASGGFSGTATNATNVGVTDDVATAATVYPLWATATTGNLPTKTSSSKLSFNPSTGVLTASGGLAGNATTATTATNATNVGITNDVATNATVYPVWATANTGNLPAKVSSTKLSFNPSTGMLTATGFTGPVTGNSSSATKLATARNINGVPFDGTQDITISGSDSTKLPLTGGTLTGALTVATAAPVIAFDENDQAGAAGKWRLALNGDVFKLDRNTAAARDFSTLTTPISVNASDNVGIGMAPTAGNRLVIQGPAGNNANAALYVGNGASSISTFPALTGGWNGLVQAGDQALIYTGSGGAETGTLVIGPQSASSKGMRIDANGAVNIVSVNGMSPLQLGNNNITGNYCLRINTSTNDLYLGQSATTIFGVAPGAGACIVQNATQPLCIGNLQAKEVHFGTQNVRWMTLDGAGTLLLPPKGMGIANADFTSSVVVRNTAGGANDDSNCAGFYFECAAQYGIKLHLRPDGYFGLGGGSSTAWKWYMTPNGDMVSVGNVIAYSDPRLKEGFRRVQEPLDILAALDGGTFYWKKGIKHIEAKAGKRDYGILADQVEAVMPEIVEDSIDIDGKAYKCVAYEKLVPVLIEAVKELHARVAALEDVL